MSAVNRGLTGDQGVMIPAANVQDLMLRVAVVKAVEEGQFHIWAVKNVDEGLEVLTGRDPQIVHAAAKTGWRSWREQWRNSGVTIN